VQAHTLGEVGNLDTVSLRVSSGIILPIFIEIGSYLTDKEQKISWHSFFETRCTYILYFVIHVSMVSNRSTFCDCTLTDVHMLLHWALLFIFSGRQHICYSALYAIARPSVCLAVCLSGRLSGRPSHGWISQRRFKI